MTVLRDATSLLYAKERKISLLPESFFDLFI